MNRSINGIDSILIRKLLSVRTLSEADNPCLETEIIALKMAQNCSPDEAERANAHLAQCAQCQEVVGLLKNMTDNGDISPLADPRLYWFSPRENDKRRERRYRRSLMVAAAVLIVTFAAVFSWFMSEKRIDEERSTLTIKGAVEDELFVAVERGASRFTLRHGDQLLPGDRIGLFYTAETSGYLAVLALDWQGTITRIFPMKNETSIAVSASDIRPLTTGALVKEGEGCEWIVAVFSDEPMLLETLEHAITRARQTKEACELELEIEEARTTTVFPYYL